MSGFGLGVIIAVMAALMSGALAQQANCVQRSEFIRHLAKTYGEQGVAAGLADNGSVVEFLNSKSGKTWTIIMTTPDGISCRLAAGSHWEPVPPAKLNESY